MIYTTHENTLVGVEVEGLKLQGTQTPGKQADMIAISFSPICG